MIRTILPLVSQLPYLLAGYDGRYYSVHHHNNSSLTPGEFGFLAIVCILLCILLIYMIKKDDQQGPQDKGCLISFFAIIIDSASLYF